MLQMLYNSSQTVKISQSIKDIRVFGDTILKTEEHEAHLIL